MNKSKHLNQWLWKWHVIGGLICLPFVALLCITGSIYLFKADFNNYVYQDSRFVKVLENGQPAALSEQLGTVKQFTDHHIVSVTLPTKPEEATSFRLHAKGHSRNMVYVNPYTNEVNGTYQQEQSFMQTVRKLHGELLLGLPGELFIELIASWFIVLILTGLYIWWPAREFSAKGFFVVRTNRGRRTFWRDMHSVLAFWASLFLLIILAGGMPWTQIFGDNLKWVQTKTDTGYPQHWRNAKGLTSSITNATSKSISLDQVAAVSNTRGLLGAVTIKLPKDNSGVYTITNRSQWLADQEVIHIDQYSGDIIKALKWNQVGLLMDLRQVFMRIHQGEYGRLNLIVVLVVALTFFVATVGSLTSYLIRRPKGQLGLPKTPETFKVGLPVIMIIALLAIVFPAFGASTILIWLLSSLNNVVKAKRAITN